MRTTIFPQNETPNKKGKHLFFSRPRKKERVCLFFFAVPRIFSSGDVVREVSARHRTQKEKGLGTFFPSPTVFGQGMGRVARASPPNYLPKNQSLPSESKGLGEKHNHSHLSLSLSFLVLFSQLGKHAWKAVVLG